MWYKIASISVTHDRARLHKGVNSVTRYPQVETKAYILHLCATLFLHALGLFPFDVVRHCLAHADAGNQRERLAVLLGWNDKQYQFCVQWEILEWLAAEQRHWGR